MKIKQKLILGYLTVALLAQGVGWVGLQGIQKTHRVFNRVVDESLPVRDGVEELKFAVSAVVASGREIDFIQPENSPSKPTHKYASYLAQEKEADLASETFESALKEYRECLRRYQALSLADTSQMLLRDKIIVAGEEVVDLAGEILELKERGPSKFAWQAKEKELEEAKKIFQEAVREALYQVRQDLAIQKSEIRHIMATSQWMARLAGLFILLTATTIGFSLSFAIANPIRQLKNAAVAIGQGKLQTRIKLSTKDELGALADAFNNMAEYVQHLTSYLLKVCESMVETLIVVTPSGKIRSANKATSHLLGYRRRELFGRHLRMIWPEADLWLQGANFDKLVEKGFQNIETAYFSKTGRTIPVLLSASVMRSSKGKIKGIVCVAQDITDRLRAEEELAQSLSLVRATLEATADGILVINQEGKIGGYNQKFVEMWRIPDAVMAAQDDSQTLAFILAQLKEPSAFLTKIRELHAQPDVESCESLEFKDGRVFERYSQPQRTGGKIAGRVWSFRDITQRKQAEEIIRYQAFHDQLTGLPNRMLFSDRLSVSLANARRNQGKLAVMFLDLDRFKTINDTLGHAVGDRLLQEVAQRLTNCLREVDTVARWGGDEFTLLLPQMSFREDAANIAGRILAALKPTFHIEQHPLHASSSIGIALYPCDGEDAETLLKNADAALYRAKERGRNNYQFYTGAMNEGASELLTLENRLHRALERGEFTLYYQPRVNINTWQITGTEALVRWLHPEQGVVSPQIFMPLAEQNGLIVPLGEWVLQAACAQNKAWQDAGLAPLRVAVNLSPRQFQQPNLVEMVARVLDQTGMEPQFLELEISEPAALQNPDTTRTILRNFYDMGVRLTVDDFGTGYASLSSLKNLPLHTLKIDRSLVRELTADPYDVALATAVIALGRRLNLSVVAEGVETQEQLDCLRGLECEEIQGYLFSQPLPAQEAAKVLQNSQSYPAIEIAAAQT